MKLTNLFLILALVFSFAVAGCDDSRNVRYRQHHQKVTNQTVHVYKQHNPNHVADSTANDEWIFWYLFFYNNNYYYYSSPNYIAPSSYSSVSWTSSPKAPIDTEVKDGAIDGGAVVAVEEQTVPNAELGTEVSSTIDTTESSISASESASESSSADGGD